MWNGDDLTASKRSPFQFEDFEGLRVTKRETKQGKAADIRPRGHSCFVRVFLRILHATDLSVSSSTCLSCLCLLG